MPGCRGGQESGGISKPAEAIVRSFYSTHWKTGCKGLDIDAFPVPGRVRPLDEGGAPVVRSLCDRTESDVACQSSPQSMLEFAIAFQGVASNLIRTQISVGRRERTVTE
jgi:hypothetical protein